MAEDSQPFPHIETNKRKFDEPSPARRSTGFSAPIVSSESYNSVPPPMDEIQLAKQKAQEIVARLVNNAESKRARFEDGSEISSANGSVPDSAQKSLIQPIMNTQVASVPFAAQPGSYYGFQGANKKMEIPNGKVGVIIGKGGETIKYLQLQSGAKIQVARDTDADPYSQTREVELIGTSEQISRAEQLIKDVISETDAGGSGTLAARGFINMQHGTDQFSMKVPNNKVALIIGKGGETIKSMQSKSGARIQVIPLHLPPGDTSTERTVHMNGTKEQIDAAKELINEVISENRVRNPMSSNYMQQGYRPCPPASWGPPGPPPMQQPGYGYMHQPGAYPGPPQPYYNIYGAYPHQSSGWDQAPALGSAQLPQQAPTAGYDYYGQQPQTGTAPANGNYGYAQGAATTPGAPPQGSYPDQGYSQQPEGYGQDGYASQAAAGTVAPPTSQPAAVTEQYDQQQPYEALGYGPPGAPTTQPEGPATQTYGSQATTSQLPPAQPVAYSQQSTTPPPSGYSSSQSQSPLPSQQGYSQATYASPGYGQQPVQKPLASQATFVQGGYPQAAIAQSGYSQLGPPPQTSYVSAEPAHHPAGNPPPVAYGQPQGPYGPQVYNAGTSTVSYGQQPQSYSGGNANAVYGSAAPVVPESGQ